VAAFIAACRAEVLSERTIEFYLEGLNAYRAFAGSDERDLTLADVDLDIGRAWLADFVERGRKPATVAARARPPAFEDRSFATKWHVSPSKALTRWAALARCLLSASFIVDRRTPQRRNRRNASMRSAWLPRASRCAALSWRAAMDATTCGSQDEKRSIAGTSTSARRRTSTSARENAWAVATPMAIRSRASER
jgi:hypothetical protein